MYTVIAIYKFLVQLTEYHVGDVGPCVVVVY